MPKSSVNTASLAQDEPTDIGEEFELDLRVVEAAYPLARLTCDTSDGCGSTCSGSACNSSMNDPF